MAAATVLIILLIVAVCAVVVFLVFQRSRTNQHAVVLPVPDERPHSYGTESAKSYQPFSYNPSASIINVGVENAKHLIAKPSFSGTLAGALPPGCGSDWFLLYNSNIHGKSFQKLVQCISGKGATLILIKLKNSTRFIGGFCESEWQPVATRDKLAKSRSAAAKRANREGQAVDENAKPAAQDNSFFGSENCFIFNGDISKDDAVCNIYKEHSSENANYMYLFDVHPLSDKIGIGMGGKDGYFGWFLDRWLDKGYCMGARCSTFKNPRLTTTEEWPVDSVEAYAVQTNEVSRLRVSGNSGDGNPSSILNNDPDREVDKVLLELHGVHRFDNHERTECLYAE